MNVDLQPITSDFASSLLVRGEPLRNYYIKGELDLYKLEDKLNAPIIIENCTVEDLCSPVVEFKVPVQLHGSVFQKCVFYAAYFLEGITIQNCVFESYLEFEAGGHNQNGNSFLIMGSTFKEFVNFFDCWFEGPVTIINNDFWKGTNLLGNAEEPYRVSFDVAPICENNNGRIDLDGDGGRNVNTVYLL